MPLRRALPALLLLLVLADVADAQAPAGGGPGRSAVFDARDQDGRSARPEARTVRERRALARELGSQGVLDIDPETGTPRVVTALDGALTGPSEDGPATVALDYVRENAAAFGLTLADLDGLRLSDRYTTGDGLTVLRWTQVADGIPAFDSGLKIAVDRAGRVLTVSGSPAHDLDVPSAEPEVTAPAALAAARREVEAPGAARMSDGPDGARRTTEFADGSVASLVVFATAGADQLAWDVVTGADDGMHHAVIDATSGKVLFRANLTKSASASVFENYPGAPGDTVDTVSLDPWLTTPATPTLTGPNARVFADVNDDNTAQGPEEVEPNTYPFTEVGDCGAFQCSWDSSANASWEPNVNQNATQVFYFLNRFHDHLESAPIGFDEDSGNFEVDDFVVAHSDDGATTGTGDMPDADHVNNANMSTPPDGQSPTMQMYLFSDGGVGSPAFRDVNGGDAASIVYHEYTHGLSNRLVTTTGGFGALDSAQAGAMGEAWSDWYAMDFLVREGYETDTVTAGEIDLGKYVDATPHQIRYQGLDCPVGASAVACPAPSGSAGSGGFTYGDFGDVFGAPEVHADGEIWAQTLWDLRRAFIAQQGSESAGSDIAEQLITDGMRLSPPEPSFLDMRNAILAAATSELQRTIVWDVFSVRGMGFFASTLDASDTTPVQSFSAPPVDGGPTGSVTGRIYDAVTGLPRDSTPVGFGGHTTFAGPFATTTGASGAYSLTGVPEGSYPQLFAAATDGFDAAVATDVTVDQDAPVTQDLAVRRDWAALPGGGEITFPADANTYCGPVYAIDHSQAVGWSEENPDPDDTTGTGVSLILKLPQAITVTSFAIDPGATCGDGASATLKNYRLETSPNGSIWTIAKNARTSGGFSGGQAGTMVPIAPTGGTTNVRYVRLTMYEPQDECEECSGKEWIDISELAVYGAPPNVAPSGTLDATVTGATASLDASSFTDPDSAITGYEWDFGDGSPVETTADPATTHDYASPGTYQASVTALDFRDGATGTAQTALTVTSAPASLAAPVIVAPAEGSWNRTGLVALSGTAPAGSDVRIYDGTELQGIVRAAGDDTWSRELNVVPDGTHVYYAYATSGAQVSPLSVARTVRVDTVAPSTTISGSKLAYVFGASEKDATFECRVDRANATGEWEPCASGVGYADRAPGRYTLRVRATDPAGNVDETPASVRFRVLTAAQAAAARLARRSFPKGSSTLEAVSGIAGLTAIGPKGVAGGRLPLRAVRKAQPVLVLGCERACAIRVRMRFATAGGRRVSSLRTTFKIRAGRARALELELSRRLVKALKAKGRLRVSLAVTGPDASGGTRTQTLKLRA